MSAIVAVLVLPDGDEECAPIEKHSVQWQLLAASRSPGNVSEHLLWRKQILKINYPGPRNDPIVNAKYLGPYCDLFIKVLISAENSNCLVKIRI